MDLVFKGKNWCNKYGREVDYELVRVICEDLHPKGCANCDEIGYKQEVEVS